MRDRYPISSFDLNDKLLMAYENLVYLLGIQSDTTDTTGLYQSMDTSGAAFMISTSGIPHCGTFEGVYQVGLHEDATQDYVVDYLRTDYILRRTLDLI